MENAESLFENDVPSPDPGTLKASDPRSAWESLGAGEAPLPLDERLERLREAARALEERRGAPGTEGGHAGRVRERLGWPRWPRESSVIESLASCREVALLAKGDVGEGVSVCAPDWRELTTEAFCRVAIELAWGRPCLLCADERAPELAELLFEVLVEAGFSQKRLALSAGVRRDSVQGWLQAGELGSLSASGSAADIVELRRLADGHGLRSQHLRTLRCSALALEPAEDLARAAERVALEAFGIDTCGGQRPGQLAQVFVPQKSYSLFLELLLESMGSLTEMSSLVPLIDRSAARQTQAAWIQGLDEGATMISGGEEEMTGDHLRLPPTIFCNVEPHMRSARRQEPMPVLCLLRSS